MKLSEARHQSEAETKSENDASEYLLKTICAFRQADLMEISSKEIREYLDLVIRGCAKTDDPVSILTDAQKHTGFLAVAQNGLHEFNTKIPNANNSSLPLFRTLRPEGASSSYVSSLTTQTMKRFGSVEGAAVSFAQKILSHQFLLDDEFTCIGVEMTSDCLIRRTLIDMGLPEDIALKIGDAIGQNMASPNKEAVPRFAKQTFFPCGQGQYVVITPVHHTGFSEEYHRRLNQIVASPNQRISFRPTHVAGANPINGGLLNSELGGRHRHLLSLPPKKRKPQGTLKNILYYIEKEGTLFSGYGIEDLNMDHFKNIEKAPKSNRRIRATRQRAIWEVVRRVTFNTTFLAHNIFDVDPKALDHLPKVERRLIDSKYRAGGKLKAEEIDELVAKAMGPVRQFHPDILNDRTNRLFGDTFKLVFKRGL